MKTPRLFLEDADASPEDASLVRRALGEHTPDLVPNTSKLLAEVDALPLRYAPFFSQIAELFDWNEQTVEEELSAMAEPRYWRRTALRGVRVHPVTPGPRAKGATTQFVSFAAGISFPKHRHRGAESVFVLEGHYTDSCDTYVGPGDLHEMPPGTDHGLRIGNEDSCVAASLTRGFDFLAWHLQLLKKLSGQ